MSRKFSISAGVETMFFGRNRIRLVGVDSTNNYAAELLRQYDITEGTLITANYQTAGRGQRANSWQSEPDKNVLCTYVLKPKFMSTNRQFTLNKLIALCVLKCIRSFCPNSNLRIKWPNDIYLDACKLSGILVESTVSGSQIVSSLAGIGINVNQMEMHVEGRKVTSMAAVLKHELVLEEVLNCLSAQLEAGYLLFRSGNDRQIDAEYDAALFKLNETCIFQSATGTNVFVLRGVSKDGLLMVDDEAGNRKHFQHGEIWMVE